MKTYIARRLMLAAAATAIACGEPTRPGPAVAAVSVTPAQDTILVGQIVSLSATTRDASGNALPGRRVTWVSADTQIASVSDSGAVTGRGVGAATITATSEHQVGIAVMTVKPVPVDSVVVEPATVRLGLSAQLKATALDSVGHPLLDRSITWASLDTTIARVSAAGVATGVAVGTAQVTASSEGKIGTAPVTVSVVPVASVTVTPARDSVRAGSFASFATTTRDSVGHVLTERPITWASSDTTVARIDTSHDEAGRSVGLAYGVRAGSATITASSEGKSGTAMLRVLAEVVSITITPAETTIVAGDAVGLVATLLDSAGHEITDRTVLWGCFCGAYEWEAIELTPRGPRTATLIGRFKTTVEIYANLNGPPQGTAIIVVRGTGAVDSVSITPAITFLFEGVTTQLRATLMDASGSVLTGLPVTWATSDASLATVSPSGLVTAASANLFAGPRITATSQAVRGRLEFEVVPASAVVAVTPSQATRPVGDSIQLSAVVTYSGGGWRFEWPGAEYEWASSDPAVATVSGTGLVTTRAVGSALITATIQGRTGSAAVTIEAFTPLALQAISVGGAHACGAAPDGAAYCWGRDYAGQLGNGSASNTAEPVPLRVTGGLSFTQLTAGGDFTCGLTTTGAAFCWGDNYVGQNGTPQPGLNLVPVVVSGGLHFTSLSAGGAHACGLTVVGEAYCWGDNDSRQLGVDTTESYCWGEWVEFQCSFTPLRVSGGLTFASISAGGYHTCGITTEQALYCWGWGDAVGVDSVPGACMERGYGDPYPCSAAPIRVRDNLRFIAVAAGFGHTCALTTDSVAYCWGSQSTDGSLGDGTFMGSRTPVAVAGGLRFEMIAAGGDPSGDHSCGIATGGTAYCWGRGPLLGDGVGSDRAVPTALVGSTPLASISAGGESSCAIARGASVAYCWGLNEYGQLGDGTTSARLTPVQVVVPIVP